MLLLLLFKATIITVIIHTNVSISNIIIPINLIDKVEQTGTLVALKFGEGNRGIRPFLCF